MITIDVNHLKTKQAATYPRKKEIVLTILEGIPRFYITATTSLVAESYKPVIRSGQFSERSLWTLWTVIMAKNCFNSAHFVLSAAKYEQLPSDTGTEIVFAGYSNVGKSSTLNALSNNKQLARVSKTPGRTQCLNVFTLGQNRRFIDLPGFGYAKVPKPMQIEWHKTIDRYFRERQSLMGIVLIMDIRNVLRPFEVEMIEWAAQSSIGLHIVLNKADKLKRQEIKIATERVSGFLKQNASLASLQILSTLKQLGIEELIETVTRWLTESKYEE